MWIFTDDLVGRGACKYCFAASCDGKEWGWKVASGPAPDFSLLLESQAHRKAQELVNSFTAEVHPPIKVSMLPSKLLVLSELRQPLPPLLRGLRHVMVEPRINGAFEKFNSNSGWSSGHDLPDALSHWTYVHSGGRLLLCDLQGKHVRGSYVFTDPAVMSVDQSFGATDLGREGISQWFAGHQCNEWCAALGLRSKTPQEGFMAGGGRLNHPLMRRDFRRGTVWRR